MTGSELTSWQLFKLNDRTLWSAINPAQFYGKMSDTEIKDSNYKPEKDENSFSYDDVLEHIGQLGRYQLRTLILLLFPCLFFGPTILSYTFVGGIPQYR